MFDNLPHYFRNAGHDFYPSTLIFSKAYQFMISKSRYQWTCRADQHLFMLPVCSFPSCFISLWCQHEAIIHPLYNVYSVKDPFFFCRLSNFSSPSAPSHLDASLVFKFNLPREEGEINQQNPDLLKQETIGPLGCSPSPPILPSFHCHSTLVLQGTPGWGLGLGSSENSLRSGPTPIPLHLPLRVIEKVVQFRFLLILWRTLFCSSLFYSTHSAFSPLSTPSSPPMSPMSSGLQSLGHSSVCMSWHAEVTACNKIISFSFKTFKKKKPTTNHQMHSECYSLAEGGREGHWAHLIEQWSYFPTQEQILSSWNCQPSISPTSVVHRG